MRVIQVCVGRSRAARIGDRSFMTAFAKRAVDGPAAVRPLGLEGDEQADLSVHGGLAKAVYAYPQEHYAFWQTVRAQAGVAPWDEPLPPGKGVSKDVGFKFDLFERRISGNVNYYQSEAQNFTATFGNRDDVDPNGINGRHGGNAYTYSKKSDGFNLTLVRRLPGGAGGRRRAGRGRRRAGAGSA